MSLANNNRTQITAWLSCDKVWKQKNHPMHSCTHKGELVWCAGYDGTDNGTKIDSKGSESVPQLVKVSGDQWSLMGLSEEHIERLRDYLVNVPVEDSEATELLAALYANGPQPHDEYACMHFDDGCRCRCDACKRIKN